MTELTDEIKKIINNIIPSTAKVGDTFRLPDNSEVVITQRRTDGRFDYNWMPVPVSHVEIRKPEKKKEESIVTTKPITTSSKISSSGTAPFNFDKIKEKDKIIKETNMPTDQDLSKTDKELLEELKDEKKDKDKKFKTNVENAIKLAEKIEPQLVEACKGIECVKTDMSKGFGELDARLKKIEKSKYICDNCGENVIEELSSFCPNCGNPVPEWKGDDGQPIRGWKHYSERSK